MPEKKQDARVRYTKMMIRNSLLELLRTKPIAKITVTEICEMAGINRATFTRGEGRRYNSVVSTMPATTSNACRGHVAAL